MNVILISIDNLRYDCVGYQPDKKELEKYDVLDLLTTPNLDALSEKGICFTQCISTNTYTTSAHASVLTGLYPPRHGVRAFFDTKLSKEIYTLPEVLRVYGYETVFSTDVLELFEPLDINRGFEHIFFLDDHNLFRFLEEKRNNRIFLFMHLFDVHAPYLLTKYEFRAGCNDDYYEEMEKLHNLFGLSLDTPDKPHKTWRDFWKKMERIDIELALPLFVKGVSKFDRGRFAWVISMLEKAGLMDNSLIVIFSDHGEGRCYLNKPCHFSHAVGLFDNVIRVPLIIHHNDISPAINNDLVSLVDIFPTVVNLATGNKAGDMLPYNLNGTDLFGNDKRSFVYSEVWTCKSPIIDFDGPAGERFVGDFWYTIPSSVHQRGIRTKDKKIVIHGRTDEKIDVNFFNLSNEEFLKNIYRYLFGREIDKAGYDYFIDELNRGLMRKEDVYRHFLDTREYKQKDKRALMVFDLEKDPYENNPVTFPREVFHRNGRDKYRGISRICEAETALREIELINSLLQDINSKVTDMMIKQKLNKLGISDIDYFINEINALELENIITEKVFQGDKASG